MPKTEVLNIKATAEQRARYTLAASKLGLTLPDFQKLALENLADKTFQNAMIQRLQRLQKILDRAGLSTQEVPWPRVLDSIEFFPDEQLEILEKRSAVDIKNYLEFALKDTG